MLFNCLWHLNLFNQFQHGYLLNWLRNRLYVPLTSTLSIQPASISAVATITPSSVSSSPIKQPLKRTTRPSDIRLKSTEIYEILSPDFCYSASKNGWIFNTCSSFATGKDDQPLMERPGNIGDHPTERFTDHLKPKKNKKATKSKMSYLGQPREKCLDTRLRSESCVKYHKNLS